MESPLHESPQFRAACGPALRPGGLELTERALELCHFPTGAHLLDVGCGSGITVERLRDGYGFDVQGIDVSTDLIGEGLLRDPTLPLLRGTAEKLPHKDGSLDGVFCECVLSLLHDPVTALNEFYRVLRQGGKLIVSDLYLRRAPHVAGSSRDANQRSRGIVSSKHIQKWLLAAGFNGIMLWEDHSRKLTELAAQIMLTHGTLECLTGLCSAAQGKPGYYLLVTEKQ